jgi:hypothetical protein
MKDDLTCQIASYNDSFLSTHSPRLKNALTCPECDKRASQGGLMSRLKQLPISHTRLSQQSQRKISEGKKIIKNEKAKRKEKREKRKIMNVVQHSCQSESA